MASRYTDYAIPDKSQTMLKCFSVLGIKNRKVAEEENMNICCFENLFPVEVSDAPEKTET
jgi:hypothetical protein